jgi:predicted transglutaminase-like protease
MIEDKQLKNCKKVKIDDIVLFGKENQPFYSQKYIDKHYVSKKWVEKELIGENWKVGEKLSNSTWYINRIKEEQRDKLKEKK